MMIAKWIFKDGSKSFDCTSFPYAFRTMLNTWKRGLEGKDLNKNDVPKRTAPEMAKSFTIVAPTGKVYSYYSAREMALNQGLLDNEGNLNGREFKKPRTY